MNLNDTEQQLYDQQPGETAVAYEAFKIYREMGDGRSLVAVGQKWGKSVSLITRWSKRWRWGNRIVAWNNLASREAETAVRRVMEAKAKLWAERELAIRDEEWAMREQVLAKVGQMLKLPIVRQEKVTEEIKDPVHGHTVTIHKTIIHPSKFDFGTAFRGIELASKLGRLATGLATDRVSHDQRGSLAVQTEAKVVLYLPDNGMRQARLPNEGRIAVKRLSARRKGH